MLGLQSYEFGIENVYLADIQHNWVLSNQSFGTFEDWQAGKQNLFKWGIEGIHYTMKDGKPTQTAEQSTAYSRDMNGMRNVSWALNAKAMAGEVAPLVALADKLKAQNEKYAIPVVNPPYESKTAPRFSATINPIMQDAKTKYIMGEIDLDGFNEAIEQWRTNGGDQIITEYTRQ